METTLDSLTKSLDKKISRFYDEYGYTPNVNFLRVHFLSEIRYYDLEIFEGKYDLHMYSDFTPEYFSSFDFTTSNLGMFTNLFRIGSGAGGHGYFFTSYSTNSGGMFVIFDDEIDLSGIGEPDEDDKDDLLAVIDAIKDETLKDLYKQFEKENLSKVNTSYVAFEKIIDYNQHDVLHIIDAMSVSVSENKEYDFADILDYIDSFIERITELLNDDNSQYYSYHNIAADVNAAIRLIVHVLFFCKKYKKGYDFISEVRRKVKGRSFSYKLEGYQAIFTSLLNIVFEEEEPDFIVNKKEENGVEKANCEGFFEDKWFTLEEVHAVTLRYERYVKDEYFPKSTTTKELEDTLYALEEIKDALDSRIRDFIVNEKEENGIKKANCEGFFENKWFTLEEVEDIQFKYESYLKDEYFPKSITTKELEDTLNALEEIKCILE